MSHYAFTISEFCAEHRISRSKLYQLWAAGQGPQYKRIGVKRIITTEQAAEWRQRDDSAAKTAEVSRTGP
jgi:hypothetical protein